MDRWQGRVALVTGASGGIGAVICEELLKHGMTVVGVGSFEGGIECLSIELAGKGYCNFFPYNCDLSKENEIRHMHEKLHEDGKYIQLCINSAVIIKNSSLLTGSTKDWFEMLEVGVLGLCINTRETVKTMLDLKGQGKIDEGQIIQMGGILGHKIPNLAGTPPDTPEADLHFYSGMKFMVRALTEGLRRELRPHEFIRVSTISPGSVETELLEKASSPGQAEAYFKRYRCLKPKDVADAVNYILATPSYLNVHDIIMEPVDFQV